MRVVFVNRFYWPETPATGQLLADLAEALAAAGHEVTVITSRAGAGAAGRETHRGVRIVRVRGTRLGGRGLPGKAADFGSFYLGALWRTLRETRRGTLLIALTDPPLIGIAAAAIAGLRGARLIHWVQDIYPELAIELAGQRWWRVLRPARDRAWRRADRCVTLGRDMAAVVESAGVPPARRVTIPNWAPAGLRPASAADIAAVRARWSLAGKFVVAYSGNLGRVHDLAPVLDVAAALRDDPAIAFAFVGGGAQRAVIETEAQRRGLANVRFLPAQPRGALGVSLGAGDVHLVTLLPGCERLVFPSKLYGIVAVGRPVFFIGPRDCELATLVRQEQLGRTAERQETAGIADALRALARDPAECTRLGGNALAFAATHDAAHGTARWRELLGTLQAC